MQHRAHTICSSPGRKGSWEHIWGLSPCPEEARGCWMFICSLSGTSNISVSVYEHPMCMSLCCVRGVFIQLCCCLMTLIAATVFCTGAALLKRKDTAEHGFIHALCLWGLTGPDTDHNLNKAGGSPGFQCVFPRSFSNDHLSSISHSFLQHPSLFNLPTSLLNQFYVVKSPQDSVAVSAQVHSLLGEYFVLNHHHHSQNLLNCAKVWLSF